MALKTWAERQDKDRQTNWSQYFAPQLGQGDNDLTWPQLSEVNCWPQYQTAVHPDTVTLVY